MYKSPMAAAALALLVLGSPAASQPRAISRAEFQKNLDAKFQAADTNHDGYVSKAELAAMQSREVELARAQVRRQLEAKFRQLDTNHDGQLSLQEFLAAAPGINPTQTPDQLLGILDANHDGKISPQEFRAHDLARFDRADTNHDGVLSPAEIEASSKK